MTTHGFEAWWTAIAPHLPMARERAADLLAAPLSDADTARMYYKARKGWHEHSGAILDMADAEVHAEALGEVDDLILYLACLAERGYRRTRQVAV